MGNESAFHDFGVDIFETVIWHSNLIFCLLHTISHLVCFIVLNYLVFLLHILFYVVLELHIDGVTMPHGIAYTIA